MNQRLAYASQRAEVLFGCYRRGDANDPERYVAAIAAVLSLYDFELIREVTDPRTGICTTEKHMTFMPNAGELKLHCEAAAVRRERFRKLREGPRVDLGRLRLPAPMAPPGGLASVHVPDSHPRHAALVEWAKTADPKLWRFGKSSAGVGGIWIAWNIWAERPAPMPNIADAVVKVADAVRPENIERLMRISDEWRDASTPSDMLEQAAE